MKLVTDPLCVCGYVQVQNQLFIIRNDHVPILAEEKASSPSPPL